MKESSSRINLHVYPSPFKFESRILRETKSIIEQKLAGEIIIASGWAKGLSEWEQIDENRSVKRFRLFFDKFNKNALTNSFKYVEFISRVWLFYHKRKVSTVNCHSLFVLPVGYLLKLFRSNTWLIYDAHELESRKTGLGKVGKMLSSAMERLLVKKVDRLIVVSPSIKKWYQKEYELSEVLVLRNTPEFSNIVQRNRVFNDKFNIPANHLIFIYQGIINKGRGIELLLETFSKVGRGKHLVIMGFGPLEGIVKDASNQHPNIHFLPAVPPDQIIYYTSGADIGLSMIENISLSYYYCLPNKLFEYLHCGLPVVVSDFPDMAAVVNEFDCGWTSPISEEQLKKLVESISIEEVGTKREGVMKARNEINWKKESALLADAFPTLQNHC